MDARKVFSLNQATRVLVAGGGGLVGRAVVKALRERGLSQVLAPSSNELDLRDREKVFDYVAHHRPELVIDAAAKVGGIHANSTYPADFISDNLLIQVNLMDGCARAEVPRFVFLGSSCIYPKFAPQPIPESALLTGDLEPTNSAYAVAKIAGIEQVRSHRRQHNRAWISAMPTNIYGPGDNFHRQDSHVVPALLRRTHEAKQNQLPAITVWGSGTPLRELLYSEDLAQAIIFLVENFDGDEHINVGSGQEMSIAEIAQTVKEVVGFEGEILFDSSKPDGSPRKLVDATKIKRLGWSAPTSFRDGLTATYNWFLENGKDYRGF